MNFAEISSVLTSSLKLRTAAIGVTPVQAAPAGVKTFSGKVPSACSLWRVAEAGMFYAPADAHHGCPVGAYTQGLPIDTEVEKVLMQFAGFMTKANYLAPEEIAKLPRLEGSPTGYVYGPLAQHQTAPALVLMWLTGRQLMLAEEATPDLAWTSANARAFGRPACAALPVATKSGNSTASLGCSGMRTFTEIADDLTLFVIPAPALEAFVEKLKATVVSNETMLAFYAQHKASFPALSTHTEHAGRGVVSRGMRLLLILSKQSYRTEAFVEAARRLDVELLLVSDRCHVLAEDQPGALPVEFSRPDEAVARMIEHGRRAEISGVLGTDDLTTALASRVAEGLGLPTNPSVAAERARNKRLQRECLRDAGARVPGFLTASISDDPVELASQARYPCVVKPTALSASRGVIRANDPGELIAAFDRIRRLVQSPEVLSRRDAAHTEILIEEYVQGPEFALEALLTGGVLQPLALFDKPDPLEGPFFEETLYVTPSRLPETAQAAIIETVSTAARAMGLREGPIHAEVRVNEDGVWILEVAARTIGGLCARTLRFGAGLSLEELVIAHATRQAPPSLTRERRPAGVMMIPIPRPGRYRGTQGLAAARDQRDVEDVVITVTPGEQLTPLPEGAGYLGFIFARAETPALVESALRRAHAELRFDIDPTLPVT